MRLYGKINLFLWAMVAALMMTMTVPAVSAAKEVGDILEDLKGVQGLDIGVEAYVDYSNGQKPLPNDQEKSYNEFRLTRGYFTAKKTIAPWMSARTTIDIHQEDNGNYIERLKYLYAELRPHDFSFLTDMKSEIGLGHIPWLDFEEHINLYRMQGTMAVERAGVFNSADTGVSLQGNFGGKIDNAKAAIGNDHYAGRHGSWHIGVYNGPGYHGTEKNNNKVVEGRVTLRPMPDALPGLQFSYFGLYGEGNQESAGEYPDYAVNLGMISYQHPLLVLTGQYFQTRGNKDGTWVDAEGDALDTAGYSLFGDFRPPMLKNLSLILRYDHFDVDADDAIAEDTAYDMYIAGVAWQVYKGNVLLLDYEATDYENSSAGKGKLPVTGARLGDDQKVQVVWKISY